MITSENIRNDKDYIIKEVINNVYQNYPDYINVFSPLKILAIKYDIINPSNTNHRIKEKDDFDIIIFEMMNKKFKEDEASLNLILDDLKL